jgi:hypothetical protein
MRGARFPYIVLQPTCATVPPPTVDFAAPLDFAPSLSSGHSSQLEFRASQSNQ